jgi:hypothetical protein
MIQSDQLSPAVAAVSAHFARLGQSARRSPASSGGRHIGSEEPRSWSGRAVRFAPFTLCLSAQGPRCTDPTIAPAFDGLKISVSRRVAFIDRSLLRSSFLGPRNEGYNRRLSPPEFPQCPTVRGLRGALAPCTEMSRMTIYLVDLLGRDGVRFIWYRVRITSAGRQTRTGHG